MTTTAIDRQAELLDLLQAELAAALKLASNRAEHMRLTRLQGHVAELKTVTVSSTAN